MPAAHTFNASAKCEPVNAPAHAENEANRDTHSRITDRDTHHRITDSTEIRKSVERNKRSDALLRSTEETNDGNKRFLPI